MKKRLIILLIACTLSITACAQEEAPVKEVVTEQISGNPEAAKRENTETGNTAAETTKVEISFEEFSGASDPNNKEYSYTYEYNVPTVVIPGNPEAAAKIQARINQETDDFLSYVNGGLFGEVFVLEDGSTLPPCYQNLKWSVIRGDEKIISLCAFNEGYEGGAHGWAYVEYFNFYTDTGDTVTFDSLGTDFRAQSEALTLKKAQEMEALSGEEIFFDNYEKSIPVVVLDGTETANEVYGRIYGEDWKLDDDYNLLTTFAITETGYTFTSDQYVLQPYVYGIIDFNVNAMEYSDTCRTDIFDMEKVQEEYTLLLEQAEQNKDLLPISAAQADAMAVSDTLIKEAQAKLGSFDDYTAIMNRNLNGTWYNPDYQTALRLTEEYAYIYYPALDMYGNERLHWKLVDRSEKGLCPMLLFYAEEEAPDVLAYYIGGTTDNYFWCNAQEEIFYKQ